MQKFGLTACFKDRNSEAGAWLGWIFGLSHLPPGEVSDCFVFDFISVQPDEDKLQQFVDYLTETYMKILNFLQPCGPRVMLLQNVPRMHANHSMPNIIKVFMLHIQIFFNF